MLGDSETHLHFTMLFVPSFTFGALRCWGPRKKNCCFISAQAREVLNNRMTTAHSSHQVHTLGSARLKKKASRWWEDVSVQKKRKKSQVRRNRG